MGDQLAPFYVVIIITLELGLRIKVKYIEDPELAALVITRLGALPSSQTPNCSFSANRDTEDTILCANLQCRWPD